MAGRDTKIGKFFPWLLALAVLACGVALFVLWRPEAGEQGPQAATAPLVETAQVAVVDDRLSITQSGFVTPVNMVPVVAEVSGRVVSVHPDFAIGGTISEGEILFEIDDDVYQADVARARAQVSQAEAQVTEAADTLARQSELEESDFASQAALQGARTSQAQAEGNLELAQAQLRTAEIALENTMVEAPFDAVVTEKDLSPGQLVQAGVSVGLIAASDAVEVQIGLSEQQFETVAMNDSLIGRTVRITPRRLGPVIGDMPPRQGTVAAVSPVLDPQSRTVEILIDVPRMVEDGPALQFNQLVVAGFAVPEMDGQLLQAPRDVLQRGQTIWQVRDDETLVRIDVDIIRQTDSSVYFTADIAEDARLLTTALNAPIDGMTVRVAVAEESRATGPGE